MNFLGKYIFAVTSFAPILGAVAVGVRNEDYFYWFIAAAAVALSWFTCWGMLFYMAKTAEPEDLHVKTFDRRNAKVLWFFLAYMLPTALAVLAGGATLITDNWVTLTCLLAVICLPIAYMGVIHTNPIISLLGYHLYTVHNDDGTSYQLISKEKKLIPDKEVKTVILTDGFHLHTGETDD